MALESLNLTTEIVIVRRVVVKYDLACALLYQA